MKKIHLLVLTISGFVAIRGAVASDPRPAPAPPSEESLSIRLWRDANFQREFLGTYGFRSDVEPRISPQEREILEQAMFLMGQAGGREAARQLLERTANPKGSAVLDFTIGNLYLQQDQMDRALLWYRRAITKFPSFLRAQKNLGLALIRSERPEEAIEPLTSALSLGAVDGLTYGLLGFAYAQSDRHLSAESVYRQAILLQPKIPDWPLGLARCLFRLRKFDEAIVLCEDLIQKDPTQADYWVLQANAYLGAKQPLKAAEIYEYLDWTGKARPEALNTLGDIYVNEETLDLAASAYLRAFEQGGNGREEGLLRAAEILSARRATEEAARLLATLRGTGMQGWKDADLRRLLKLEARLAASRGDSDETQIQLLEEIVRLDPLDGEALLLLGTRYASAGDLDRAFLQFERAAGIEAFAAEACLRHSQQLVRQRRFSEALPLLKRSLEIRPREDVTRYLEQVERLAKSRS
ncbi:MAG: tetratricopeptide repeat protein [Kiritimatiellia bacterium]|nr:tetratricopeptide repeat protein [Kiritimatiellia bacterium]